jgi:hypothetical protein
MVSNNNINTNTINTTGMNNNGITGPSSSRSVSGSSQTGGNYPAGSNSPAGLEKGQVVKGEVIDLKNNEVTVKLEDGQVIKGRLAADGIDLSIGSKVTFRVEDASSQSLILKILPPDSDLYLESTIDNALEAANLNKSDRNKIMVVELLKAGMSIDKNTLTVLSKQMLQFPDSSLKTLIFLNRSGLPVNNTNITFMESFLNSSGKVSAELYSLSENIIRALSDGDDTSSKYKLLSILLPSAGTAEESVSKAAPLLSDVLNQEERNALAQNLQNSQLYTATPGDTADILSGRMGLPEIFHFLGDNSPLLKDTGLSSLTLGEEARLLPGTLKSRLPELDSDIINKLLISMDKATEGSFDTPDSIGRILSREERLEFLSLLKGNFPSGTLPDSITHGLTQGNISAGELLSQLKPFLSGTSDLTEKDAEKIISSKAFNKLLSSSLMSQWSISPEEFAKPASISSHYESLLTQLNNIRELMENTSFKEASALQSQTAHITDTVNFMNTLNNLFAYLQLPVKLKSQYADSELYVYSNKKSELDITEGVRVVLHLKMDNLGPVDVAIELKQNQLKNSFYLENKEIKELLSSHMETLETKLKDKGYQVRTEFYNRAKESDSPAAMVKEHLLSLSRGPFVRSIEKKRYHFDIRA